MTKKNNIEKQLEKIDAMNGLDFEKFVANLLKKQNYQTNNIKDSGDFGVDVIAEKSGVKYAIQVKRYKGSVSRTAVSDAVTGKIHWKCDKAWVFTSGYFTKDAKTLAESTDCKLTDRDDLTNILYQQKELGIEAKKSYKKAFFNFIFTLTLFNLIMIFLVSQTSPKTWAYVKTRLFAPAKVLVEEVSSWLFPNSRITKTPPSHNPENTLTPIGNAPLPAPEFDENGIPILQPVKD